MAQYTLKRNELIASIAVKIINWIGAMDSWIKHWKRGSNFWQKKKIYYGCLEQIEDKHNAKFIIVMYNIQGKATNTTTT